MLAVKITEETYPLYQECVENSATTVQHDLEVVNGAILVKDESDPDNWTWMDQEHFDVTWKFQSEEDAESPEFSEVVSAS